MSFARPHCSNVRAGAAPSSPERRSRSPWTPCVGPTLGAILGLATTAGGTAKGGLLLAVYSAGLALPFLFSAVAFNAATRAFTFFKRHYSAIQVGSGLVLIGMGYLVLTGELFQLNIQAQQFLSHFNLNFFQSV
ncbi:cytochrome c biogenesis CcdA family protein [Conexibacter sp. DBS9H8]|uniref:cytochrome c biogenesis CcdA family protein n=1 Tax=Conexibacter sp. DBS9H8 TaxID=2937801 RepID=UPI00200E32FE|nr:cytochrome c biogenesis protein CcdA [Conexibacter sp. DBS9H8]